MVNTKKEDRDEIKERRWSMKEVIIVNRNLQSEIKENV